MYGVVSHLLFLIIRLIYLSLRSFIWWLNDYHAVFSAYETSAHVEKIVYRSKADIFNSIKPYQFIGYHEKFDHPECVLGDNYILTCVTKSDAVFLQMPKSVWFYSADKAPFCWLSLYEDAINTVTMPVSSFHRLADKVGGIKQPSMIIWNEGRCGSTLLCNLMTYSNSRVLALSEPDPFPCVNDLVMHRKEMGDSFDRLLRSAAILSFKPVEGAEAIVVKARTTANQLMILISELVPEIKHVYIRRKDALKTVQSWERSFQSIGQIKLYLLIARLNLMPFLMKHVFKVSEHNEIAYHAGFKYLNMKNPFEVLLMLWSNNLRGYMRCSEKYPVTLVYYEDLLKKSEEIIRTVFKLLAPVEPTSIEKALKEGLKTDSQKETPLSMKLLQGKTSSVFTPDVKKRVDAFLAKLGLPRFD